LEAVGSRGPRPSQPPSWVFCRPSHVSQSRHLLHAARDDNARLGLGSRPSRPRTWGSMFWRAFSEGERAQEVGESRTADLTRGRTVVEVCEAETTGGLRQDSARYCTAGTEAKGGRQPLSARDMDMGMGMGTRRMLACNGCNCPICLPMASSLPRMARSELPHQISFGTAVSRMRLDDLGCTG
jgi:hypothetical protein